MSLVATCAATHFFQRVLTEQVHERSIIRLVFKFTALAPHALIMVSQRLRDKLLLPEASGGYGCEDKSIEELRKCISQAGQYPDGSPAPAWLNTFKLGMTAPEKAIEQQEMNYPSTPHTTTLISHASQGSVH